MNLKALSEQLGLSQTTVSRALNGYPEVGKKTRERVLKAAAELNYRPNRFAKSLATGKTKHIGIIYPTEHNLITPLFNEFLGGITEKLVEAGLDLNITPTTTRNELETYHDVVRSGRVDGLIISSPLREDPRIQFLIETNMPFIVHGRTDAVDMGENPQPAPFSFIDVDNVGGFEKATQLLLNMGHQHIALINGDERLTFAHHRYQGYKKALQAQAQALRNELKYSFVDMTEKNGFEAATNALQQSPRPSAFLVSSIVFALGAKRAIREAGLVLGKDIALITYDDCLPYLEADKFNPTLTTIQSPIRQAGYAITQHLYEMIQSGGQHQTQKILDVDLIVRGSTCTVSV